MKAHLHVTFQGGFEMQCVADYLGRGQSRDVYGAHLPALGAVAVKVECIVGGKAVGLKPLANVLEMNAILNRLVNQKCRHHLPLFFLR